MRSLCREVQHAAGKKGLSHSLVYPYAGIFRYSTANSYEEYILGPFKKDLSLIESKLGEPHFGDFQKEEKNENKY
jgi:hypothetical protein